MTQQALAVMCSNLAKTWWLRSLHFQRFQALLPFFSKSFSPFPHGTCLLSVLSPCVALDEAYHQHCAPIPRRVTLGMCTVHSGLAQTHNLHGFSRHVEVPPSRHAREAPQHVWKSHTTHTNLQERGFWGRHCSLASKQSSNRAFGPDAAPRQENSSPAGDHFPLP